MYHYRTSSDFSYQVSCWTELLVYNNRQNTIQCPSCEQDCSSEIFELNFASVLFIEFSLDCLNVLTFEREIRVFNQCYQLKGLIRNSATHFSCAVLNDVWEYIDDLRDNSRSFAFNSLNKLFQHSVGGWFFGIYVLSNEVSAATRCENFRSAIDLLRMPVANNESETDPRKESNERSNLNAKERRSEKRRAYYCANKESINKRRRELYAAKKLYNTFGEFSVNETVIENELGPGKIRTCSREKQIFDAASKALLNIEGQDNHAAKKLKDQNGLSELKYHIKEKVSSLDSGKQGLYSGQGEQSKGSNGSHDDQKTWLNQPVDKTQLTEGENQLDHCKQIHEQDFAVENMQKFHKSMQMAIQQCSICFEAWPVKVSGNSTSDSQKHVCK